MSLRLSRIRYALPNRLIFLLVSSMYEFSSPIQWCSITTVFVSSLPKMPAQLNPRATPSDLPSFCLNPADWLSSGLPVLLSPSPVSILWVWVFLSMMNQYHKPTRSCWWIALALIILLSIWSCVIVGICTDFFLRHQTHLFTITMIIFTIYQWCMKLYFSQGLWLEIWVERDYQGVSRADLDER